MFMRQGEKRRLGASRLCGLRFVLPFPPSPDTRPLWCDQPSPQQVQVRQRKRREQPRGVLGKAAVAHLRKSPQSLDHVKGMLAARPGAGTDAIDSPLVLAQWLGLRATTVDPVADSADLRTP